MSTVDSFRLALRRLTISPAFENTLSDGVDQSHKLIYGSGVDV
jgi:hypothetical protein